METKAAIENVKIGQMINASKTSGGFDEGYYLGTTNFNEKRVLSISYTKKRRDLNHAIDLDTDFIGHLNGLKLCYSDPILAKKACLMVSL